MTEPQDLAKVRNRARRLWGALQDVTAPVQNSHRGVLVALLAGCFVLRLGLAWALPNIHQADEIYQVSEQANRAANGYGIVSWEFQARARAALLPLLVQPLFEVQLPVEARQMLLAAIFTAASLMPVWVAFRWVRSLHGLSGGLLAGFMMGTWLELVYFAPKPSPDAISGYLLLAAVFLGRPGAMRRGVFLAGVNLMVALGIRIQILPAVGLVLVLIALVRERRTLMPLAGGLAAGLAFVGAAEWLWWGTPFLGHWRYFAVELNHGVSAYFGRQPLTFFVKNYVLMYGGAVAVAAFLCWIGAKSAPILALTTVAVAAPFHLIGHKEYRFLMPAVPFVVLLMAIATANLISRFGGSRAPAYTRLVAVGWLVSMVAMSLGDFYRPFWTRDRNHILAFRQIGAQTGACGVALVGMRWWHTPGYSGLGRDVPIYEIRTDADLRLLYSAANFVLVGHKVDPPPAPYVRWQEYSRPVEYVYRRPGGCVTDGSAKVVRPPAPPGIVVE